jgi:hypothetical protein
MELWSFIYIMTYSFLYIFPATIYDAIIYASRSINERGDFFKVTEGRGSPPEYIDCSVSQRKPCSGIT